jgi:hypothetical protein
MVGCMRRPRKRAKVQFAEPPWNERSDEWQIRDQQVPADHPAREVVEAMRQLDMTPLFALYRGAGVPPIRPDLMLGSGPSRHSAGSIVADIEPLQPAINTSLP